MYLLLDFQQGKGDVGGMDATPFFVLVGAVSAANILSFGLIWSLAQIIRKEREGGEAPILNLIIILFCLFFIGGGIYLATA